MLSNYHTLGYISSTLQASLPGMRISQIFTQNPEELAIGFGPDTPFLILSCRPDLNALYLHDRFARARTNTADVLPDAVGRTITDVHILPGDRVVSLPLASGGRLLLQLFGAQANALLVDSAGIVIDAFLRSRSRIGTRGQEPTEALYDVAGLPARLQASGTATLASVLRTAMPTLGTTLLRELLFRSSLLPSVQASTLDPDRSAFLCGELIHILDEIRSPKFRIYSDSRGVPASFSLIPLQHRAECSERTFEDIHAAIRFFVSRRRSAHQVGEKLSSLRTSLRQQHDRTKRTLRAMEEDARESERADQYESWGRTLMAHLDCIRKGDAVFDPGGAPIPLERALSPTRNAQRYFEKAKRARTAAAQTSARIGPARERLFAAQTLLDRLDTVSSEEDFRLFQEEHATAMELLGLSEKARHHAAVPFRVFTVEGNFEVWVGKSSTNNDLLTLHHAKPNDLWFHARGCSGSHVLLKIGTGRGTPGKRAKEQAAAIAAYFSKMKTASIVPVAMTERKYVRKPKGASPGSVTLERESVLFVTPLLPGQSP